MQKRWFPAAEAFVKKNQRQRLWRMMVRWMACIVVFCTTYVLILPAITMERAKCELEEHKHSESCYEKVVLQQVPVLACTYESLNVHSHTDDCYDAEGRLICATADFLVHEHDASCLDESGALVCQLPEIKEHEHTDDCYKAIEETVPEETVHVHNESCYTTQRGALLCQINETAGHVHTESCYKQGELLCQKEEAEGHTHGENCSETVLNCELTTEPHIHTESCYRQLTCELSTEPSHVHDDNCSGKELKCELTEQEHVHTDSCYQETLVCEITDDPEHVHEESCFVKELICDLTVEPHEHTDACYEQKVCEISVEPAHVHTDACNGKVLECELTEQEHIHTESCYQTRSLCDLAETEGHAHTAECYEQLLTCGQEEVEAHQHTDSCYEQTTVLNCQQEETIPEGTESTEETAAEATEPELELVCEKEVIKLHSHEDGCYETYLDENEEEQKRLICTELVVLEHIHGEGCIVTKEVPAEDVDKLTCTLAEGHVHEESCYDENGELTCTEAENHTHGDMCYGTWKRICDKEEHTHTEECLGEPETDTYCCGKEAHTHTEECYDAEGNLTCGLEEHTHTEECLPLHSCGKEAHAHGESCYDAEGKLTCGLDEHIHNGDCYGLTGQQWTRIEAVIKAIDSIPSAGEIDARMAEYNKAGDETGLNAWMDIVSYRVKQAYSDYSKLDDELKVFVTNADKLMELEYLWKPKFKAMNGFSDVNLTPIESAHTSDFVTVNLYNYDWNVNNKWRNNTTYPGFSWPGGVSKAGTSYTDDDYLSNKKGDDLRTFGIPNYVANRKSISIINFGDALVENFDYASSKETFESANYGAAPGQVNFVGETGQGLINTSDDGNHPIGISRGTQILNYKLGTDGAPVLATGESLGYLFPSTATKGVTTDDGVTKQNATSIDGLFQINPISGLYSFNSRQHHAQYNENTDRFELYNAHVTPNFILYPFGNFLPFNSITDTTALSEINSMHADRGGMHKYVSNTYTKLDAWLSDVDAKVAAGEAIDGVVYTDPYAVFGYSARKQLSTILKDYVESWYFNEGNTTGWQLTASQAVEDFFEGGQGPDGASPDFNAILENMYNIDWDVPKDFFFGMDMSMNLLMPKDGLTGQDIGDNSASWTVNADGTFIRTGDPDGIPDYPMTFNFAGDDDVWVYVDDVLFLDLSGIHRHVGGTIDFETGVVYYFALDLATGETTNNTVGAQYYLAESFESILKRAGYTDAQIAGMLHPVLNDDGTPRTVATTAGGSERFECKTFNDHTTHKFKFFYMERGSGSSVCRMNFNFPIVPDNSITISKENVAEDGTQVLGNPDYYFNVLRNGATTHNNLYITEGTPYRKMDKNGEFLKNEDGTDKIFRVGEYGIFTLKNGETAVFDELPSYDDVYYVQELIKEKDVAQYDSVLVYDSQTGSNGAPQWSGEINWGVRRYFTGLNEDTTTNIGPEGLVWYGYSSQNINTRSDLSFNFVHNNNIDEEKLAALVITKIQDPEPEEGTEAPTFIMHVQLDGKDLPVGTKYTIGNVAHTVTVAGQIPLKHNETAVIENILTGTPFRVWEDNAAAEDYVIRYYALTTGDNPENVELVDGVMQGILRVNTQVQITVANTSKSTFVEIPVKKQFRNYVAGDERTYTFNIIEVDAGGNSVENGHTDTATVTLAAGAETGTTVFRIPYSDNDYASLAEGEVKPHYYRITESANADSLPVEPVTVQVDVKKESDGAITATLKDHGTNAPVTFTNTLITSLQVSKVVQGSQADSLFGFKLELPGVTAENNLSFGWVITKTSDHDQVVGSGNATYAPETGYEFSLKNDQTITFTGLPIGLTWQVTETSHPGYLSSHTIGGVTVAGDATGEQTLAATGNQVEYTNISGYELPHTGATGAISYTMAGVLLILLGTAYLMYRSKARRRGAF